MPARAPVTVTVTFSLDSDGQAHATVVAYDKLALDTVTKAMEEFWRDDRKNYASQNEKKWQRRLR
jgi:hypothetical protein